MAQEWLNRRFLGVLPVHFENGVFIYGISGLQPPEGWGNAWCSFDPETEPVIPPDLSDYSAILIICSPCEDSHIKSTSTLLASLNVYTDFPPVYWVPHSVAPEERQGVEMVATDEVVIEVMEHGVDDVIEIEREGFDLVTAVRTRIQMSNMLASMLNTHIEQRRHDARALDFMQNLTHDTLWGHLRVRCAPALPPVDPDLPSGELQAVPGYTFGPLLGKGSFCSVHRLVPAAGAGPGAAEEVIKSVDKATLTEPEHVKQIGRMVEIMLLLNQDGCRHPNIAHFTGIYHSPTHIFFRETFGGPESLFRRLTQRERGEHRRPLSLEKTVSLMAQLCATIAHLHTGPCVCHRDVKPENILIDDDDAAPAITMKLTDFDLAMVQKGNLRCKKACGTIPFIAPEVLLEHEYDGMAADVWSIGSVLFEVLCGIRVMDKIIPRSNPKTAGERKAAGTLIQATFSPPHAMSAMLEERCLENLRPLLPAMRPLLDGTCTVALAARLTAQQTSDATKELQSAAEQGRV